MSRWGDEFEAEVSTRNPHAISAIRCQKVDSGVQTDLMAPNGTNGTGQSHQQSKTDHERVHEIVLLGQPDSGDVDNDDPVAGEHIIRDVRAGGGWITIEHGKIVLRWRGVLPGVGNLIDRIREAREGVVLAAQHEDAKYERLEREAIQDEADFSNARLPGDDGGK